MDGILFVRQLVGRKFSWWVNWVRIDGRDCRKLRRQLGGGEISCWLNFGQTRRDGRQTLWFCVWACERYRSV
jgi:hypothetical protein